MNNCLLISVHDEIKTDNACLPVTFTPASVTETCNLMKINFTLD